jgi:predicted porin
MQVKYLVAALCAAFPLLASAQSSVTMYGVVDAAVAHEDNGAPGGARTVVNSGNQSSNRLGFRGVEEIGNGLKAVFNLEAGLALDTGAADTVLFGRRAVVGLEGGFGALTIGREYTPIADIAAATDINGQGFYGTNLSSFNAGRLTRRISNSVNYRSSLMRGFKLGLAYGLGETTTGPSQNLMGVGASYTMGNLYLGAGYHTIERQLSGDDKDMMVGAAYKIGAVELKANYMAADPAGANNKYEQVNLGAALGFGANKVYANLQRNALQSGAKGNAVSLAYAYTLSKRTNVYASYATLRNNATGLFGLNSPGVNVNPPASAPGADPSVLALGVRHTF